MSTTQSNLAVGDFGAQRKDLLDLMGKTQDMVHKLQKAIDEHRQAIIMGTSPPPIPWPKVHALAYHGSWQIDEAIKAVKEAL